MNLTEKKMVDALKDLRDSFAVAGVKAEFEAEGTRTEELMRLKEICLAAGVSLTLKIGGCEAVRDMCDARAVGVDHLVAPMVETPFALRKYLRAKDLAFPKDEQEQIEFLVNIETGLAASNFAAMLELPESSQLDGIVIGRSDLTGSLDIDRREIDGERVFQLVRGVLVEARRRKLTCVIGGTITAASLDFLGRLCREELLDRFETRKVCFACREALAGNAAEGIRRSLGFELLWLENKSDYYRAISREDEKRIAALRQRLDR